MQYMLLINDDPSTWSGMTEDQVNAVMGEYFALLVDAIRKEGIFVAGDALQGPETAHGSCACATASGWSPTARSRRPRRRGRRLLHRRVPDLDAAIDSAARFPGSRFGGVEVVRSAV